MHRLFAVAKGIGERSTVEDTILNWNNIYTAVRTCAGDICVTTTVPSWDR